MKSPRHLAAELGAALLLGLACAAANAFELRGFRGVAWGDSAEALGSAVMAATDGDIACYQRERENLLFGDSALNDVRYCFHQDRLVMVTLDAAVDHQALVAQFQRTYGRPDARKGGVATWVGKASGPRAELVGLGSAAARLTLYANRIDAAVAERMHRLAAGEPTQRIVAAF